MHNVSYLYESFYLNNRKLGVIARKLSAGKLETLTCFKAPDQALFHVEHIFNYETSVFDWNSFTFIEHHEARETHAYRRGKQIYDRESKVIQDIQEKTIPGYSIYLIIKALSGGERPEPFYLLTDGDPSLTPKQCRVQVSELEEVHRRNDELRTLRAVQCFSDGERNQTFWISEGQVIKSDWCGAESYKVSTLSELSCGLDREVIEVLEAF